MNPALLRIFDELKAHGFCLKPYDTVACSLIYRKRNTMIWGRTKTNITLWMELKTSVKSNSVGDVQLLSTSYFAGK